MDDHQAGDPKLAVWRALAESGALQCPVCRGALTAADRQFHCLSCAADYPVEGGVPLLMRPSDLVSIPEQVMGVFNIPPTLKHQVETALATLTKYRTYSHPEFGNFFARFDRLDGQLQVTPLTAAETAASVGKVECLTQCLPETLPSEEVEFRSLRLRNGSDRVLFTDERNRLYISYRLFTPEGAPVAFEGSRSPLPCPLRPGAELTVPVMVKLPPGLTGRMVVRFYFVLVQVVAAAAPPTQQGYRERARSWLSALRHAIRPDRRATGAGDEVHWFDALPLAEIIITAVAKKAAFPATQRGALVDFEVQEDVNRADAFLLDVLAALRTKGLAKPRVLEIGAGVYPILLRTSDANMTVIVSDISLVMQTLAAIMHRNNPAVLDGRAGFASFDMMYPPFRDGSFDMICICAALHHIPSPEKFLARLAPLLSAQGRFVAVREPCVVNPFAPTYITELSNGFNEQMFELSEWREIIGRGGFAIDQAVIDFDCSLKFSARLAEFEQAA